ncbi:hypothetical protein ACFLIM_35540 [Nonomuraea sp. M3C6]|uniref:Uncharacterized protein n=1 Tax=Nonomuraea marmarensis TaxID=3351344 RepID=A0ABW7AMA3_9ACTN
MGKIGVRLCKQEVRSSKSPRLHLGKRTRSGGEALAFPAHFGARRVRWTAEWNSRILPAWRKSDRADLARLLPGFIGELHVQAATETGPARDSALRLLIWACSAAASDVLKAFGHLDLAWIASDMFARELVADLLERVGGRDVRGLAWRMNLI